MAPHFLLVVLGGLYGSELKCPEPPSPLWATREVGAIAKQ